MSTVELRVESGAAALAGESTLLDLLSEDLALRRIGEVGKMTGERPAHSKSVMGEVLGLVVSGAGAGALVTIHRTVVAFLNRTKARSVTVRYGDVEVVIQAHNVDETRAILEQVSEKASE